MTRSLSDIIKSNFVSFSDQKRTIKTIDNNHPKILQSSVKAVEPVNHLFEDLSNESFVADELHEDFHRSEEYDNSDGEVDELSNERFSDHLNNNFMSNQQQSYQEGQQQGYQEGFAEGSSNGFNEGYANGQLAAQEEINIEIDRIQKEMQLEHETLVANLEQEFKIIKRELEPKMLSIIERLVKKIIGVQSLNKETIMYLIRCGIDELELHGDLIIKVSPVDLDYVIENKKMITEDLSEKIQVEILKDLQLVQNECVIETDMGTIDCSLGVQLEGLMKELRLIRDSLLNES